MRVVGLRSVWRLNSSNCGLAAADRAIPAAALEVAGRHLQFSSEDGEDSATAAGPVEAEWPAWPDVPRHLPVGWSTMRARSTGQVYYIDPRGHSSYDPPLGAVWAEELGHNPPSSPPPSRRLRLELGPLGTSSAVGVAGVGARLPPRPSAGVLRTPRPGQPVVTPRDSVGMLARRLSWRDASAEDGMSPRVLTAVDEV
jgi:hypothetical protein